jgi:hypothetical protein
MAASDKNILISPQRGSTTQVPSIVFTGDGNDPITLRVLDGVPGSISFEGGAGQLFSLTNNLTTGSIFSVNDISGLPSLDVNASGAIQIAPYGGTVAIGKSTVTAGQTVDIKGNLRVDGTLTITSTASIANLNADFLDGLNSTQFLRSDTSGTLSGALTLSHSGGQLILDNSAQADPRWGFLSWTSGLNIYPIDAASTIFIGRDGQATTIDLFNITNVAVAGTNILNSSRQLSNVTFGGNTIWHAGNDGSGSGLDADLLDGLNVTTANTGSTVVSRDASGNFSAGTITATLSGSASSLALSSATISSSSWAGGGGYHGYTYTGNNFRFGFSSTSGIVDVYADGNFYATDSSHLVWHAGNDGAGSGLDADLLDGENLVDNASTANTVVGRDGSGNIVATNLQPTFQTISLDTQKAPGLYHYDGAFGGTKPPDNAPNYRTIEIGNGGRYTEVALPWNSANMYFRRNTDGAWSSWSTVWHNDNDGSGSGLDADLLDGLNSTSFLRSNADTSASGVVDFLGGTGTTPAVRVRSGGNSWSEGMAVHPLGDNGFALTFYRTRQALTDSTNTWAIGNLGTNSTNNFGLLRNGLTGGSAIRADAIFDVTQAGVLRLGFNPTVGSNAIWHAGNDGSGSGLDADTLDGYQWDTFGKNIRGTEIYADNWFRNYNSGEGLYNEATGMHWYSDANWRWRLYSTSSSAAILFTTNGDTARGYVYADTASSIGFLNTAGEWGLRYLSTDGNSPNLYFREEANENWSGNPGNDEGKVEYHSNRFYIAAGANSTEVIRFRRSGTDVALIGNDGFIYSPRFVDWNDNAFYADPASTSIFNTLNLNFLEFNGQRVWDTANTTQNGTLNLGYLLAGSVGNKLYTDEDFNSGTNSISLYNNAGGTALSFSRIADSTAPNSSRQILRFVYNGGSNGTSPNFGGFYFATGTSANRTLVCRFKARLKAGSQFGYHSNAIGTNGTQFWVTSQAGTGRWEEYVSVVMCGDSGTFSSTHFYAVSGGSFANGETLFDLASASVYDVTNSASSATLDNLNISGNGSTLYGPNSTWSASLRVGGNGNADTTNASVVTTNGNLHLDARTGGYASYLNYYKGGNGTAFGNGAQGIVAWMGPDGDLWKGSSDNTGSVYWHAGNDGSGSGLDADLLDGLDSTRFLRWVSDFSNNTQNWNELADSTLELRIDGVYNSSGGTGGPGNYSYGQVWSSRTNNHNFQLYASHTASNGDKLRYRTGWDNGWYGWATIWDSVGDGAGSGLDADLWDGYQLSLRTNWSTNSAGNIVVGQLSWKNYGNNHTIFDASQGTSPDGGAVNNTNSQVAWSATYPTLMGWNGSNTYGVRVDSARVADSALSANVAGSAAQLTTARLINGVSFNGLSNINIAASTPNAITFNNGGAGNGSGSNFTGAAALTVSYNTIGAPSTTGANASGTWAINITGNASTASGLPTYYIGGQQTNPQTYFGQSVGLRVAMTGFPSVWADTLWINGYAGGDVLQMCALHTLRNGTPRMYISAQASNGTTYGTTYEFFTTYNDGAGSGLDADLLDGLQLHTGRNNEANKVVRTDGSGYLQTGYINSSNGNEGNNSSPSRVWGTNGSDDYLRTYLTTALQSGYCTNTTQGFNSNWNTDFQAAPAGSTILRGDTSTGSSTGGPGNTWWFQQNMRHGNGSNFWGVQVAWGWEDNANRLRTRNVQNGAYAGWIDYWNSANDGSGSGLDADLLDGINSGSFARVDSSSTFTVATYFQSNLGATSGSLSSPPLQAYATGGNAAFMSFHRAGAYAVNFGLDSDNVLRIGGWSASANRWVLDMSGNMTAAGNVTAYSDINLKRDIQPIENALAKVLAIRGVTFIRTDQEDDRRHCGVIAQEVEEVLPEVVQEHSDGIKSVAYGNMVGLLIEAIKEQQKQIESLRSEIENLKGGN